MDLWEFINDKLNAGQRVALLLVVDSQGSSPGRQGFKMALAEDGAQTGSVGGGAMERRMLDHAAGLFRGEWVAPFLVFQEHRSLAGEHCSGLVCQGDQTVVFVALDGSHLPGIVRVRELLERGESAVLEITPQGLAWKEDDRKAESIRWSKTSKEQWVYEEPIDPPPTLYLFGGGHVSHALSRQFSLLGFRICLFDDRPDLALFRDNPFATRKEVVDYAKVASLVPEGRQVYVVIMSAAHETDSLILEQLIGKRVRFLGMLGSRKKTEAIFNSFMGKGIPGELLARVASPVGLPIGSRTPEEIAVSIAAQIIQVKNDVVVL